MSTAQQRNSLSGCWWKHRCQLLMWDHVHCVCNVAWETVAPNLQ
jgi:hypothetical protein